MSRSILDPISRRTRSGHGARALVLGLLAAAAAVPACDDGPRSGVTPPEDTEVGAAAAPRRVIVALGDSITAGYGLAPDEAWPALLQQKIDALGLDYEVRNAGLSGDTTAGGLRRLDWVLRQPVGVLILALGGNDGLRGVPPETIEQNLQSMIDQARAAWPDVRIVLAGMKAVPNMGRRYAEQFSELFARVAERNGVAFVPFLLDDVGGMRSLNQPDGIHPTAEGQEVVAENVWEVLEEVLEEG